MSLAHGSLARTRGCELRLTFRFHLQLMPVPSASGRKDRCRASRDTAPKNPRLAVEVTQCGLFARCTGNVSQVA
ncbi:hypothetical protein AWV79_35795 [Cupriavidus sp. UYMMa02A]|nr:hypothetical protein AWV79_35795 [Cupriavidus sp. UYMMa02A]